MTDKDMNLELYSTQGMNSTFVDKYNKMLKPARFFHNTEKFII